MPTAANRRASWHAGMRAAVPFAAAGSLVAVSFGVLARDVGMSSIAAISMSALVHAGSAQFAAVSISAAGGSIGAAVAAAALMNSRFLPMGVSVAPSFPGGPLKRAAQGQAVVDPSWAMAAEGDGSYDRWFLFGSTAVLYPSWVLGTAVGALGGEFLGDPSRLGLDAVFPAFFLALLLGEMQTRAGREVAVLGALIALALVPVAPPGVPILAAGAAAAAGLRRRRASR